MDFLKKNYEKLLLGAVLLGLAGVAAFLPFKIGTEKQKLQDLTSGILNPPVQAITNLDISATESDLKRSASSVVVNLGPPHKLFAPMPWQKAADGHLIPMDDTHIGPQAVAITELTPLYLIITLDSVSVLDSGTKYVIGLQREAAALQKDRSKKQTYSAVGAKNDTFTLREVLGSPENPTNIVLELKDGTTASLSKETPFKRVEGYAASLKYEPEKKSWRDQRVGASISLNGEDYNIVAISASEVVLSAKKNQKKWTITYNASGTPEQR
jgi:hypothetical protein